HRHRRLRHAAARRITRAALAAARPAWRGQQPDDRHPRAAREAQRGPVAAPYRAHLPGAARPATGRADRLLDHPGTAHARPGRDRPTHARLRRPDYHSLPRGHGAADAERRRAPRQPGIPDQLPLRDGRGMTVRRPLLILVLLATLPLTGARAQEFAALVSPPRFELTGKSGQTIRQVFELTNRSAAPAKFHVHTADFTLDANYTVN